MDFCMYCYTGLALPSLQLLAHGLASTDSFAFVLTQSCPVAGARVNKVVADYLACLMLLWAHIGQQSTGSPST